MKILMITSEAVPFAKSGGLADMVTALSMALSDHDVRVLMPRYPWISTENLANLSIRPRVPLGFGEEEISIFEGLLPDHRVPVYFLDHPLFSSREGIYGSREEGDFPDNHKRFTLLSRSPFPLCRELDWIPDIFHSHDWTGALTPVYLKTLERDPPFKKSAGILTIHNLGYQGIFSRHDIHTTQLDWESFQYPGAEKPNDLNFLLGGIKQADRITTVSPTYSREIQESKFGFSLDRLLRLRSNVITGILNGMDYETWDPSADPHLPYSFDVEDLAGKALVKEALQNTAGLQVDPGKPLFGIVSRLAEQKGFDALIAPGTGGLHRICSEIDLQFVILGTGAKKYEEELSCLAEEIPNLSVFLEFSESTAHLIEGGSDFFLMPSVYEPCGLNQMYSLRYGAIPIVRKTGGLADTIDPYNEDTGEGTGFLFPHLTPESLFDVISRASRVWYNREQRINDMRRRGMMKRFTWEKSSKEYLKVYREALEEKKTLR
jgi:starch synthase